MGETQTKEPAMDKHQVWYGVQNNEVRFSTNKADLNNAGIDNPRSFTVNGTISDLPLTGSQQTSQASSGQQPA
jgi:hypothetical protein